MKKTILNLGAGTQSSVIYLQMCRGSRPAADVAVFADTQWEPPAVYQFLEWLKKEGRGVVPIVTVSAGNLRDDAIAFRKQRKSDDGKRYASIPLYVLNLDGSRGMIRRQCTKEYKIAPIEKYIRTSILGLKSRERVPAGTIVEQIFGISFDERQRMRAPDHKWTTFSYPLVDEKKRRQQVIEWAEKNYPSVKFPRSACIGCPYRSNREWRDLRDNDPQSFADAIDFDREIRVADAVGQSERKMLVGIPFIHRSVKPLSDKEIDEDGPGLWDGIGDNECSGMCGT